MNKSELVSIITPAFNAEEYVSQTIDSVLAQTYTNWELLIVDDGSTDETSTIVKNYSDPRVVLIKQRNYGMGQARNSAIQKANGSLVAFIDADDCWAPTKLEKQVSQFVNQELDITFCSGNFFGDHKGQVNIPSIDCFGRDFISTLVKKNVIPILSVMIRMPLLKQLNGFLEDKSLGIVADYHLWLKACHTNARIKSYPLEYLFYYRIHEGQSTSSSKQLNTTLAVCRMLKLLYLDNILTEENFKEGCKAHIRILLDQKLKKSSNEELNNIFSALKEYNFNQIKLYFIKKISKFNRNFAHKISWRLLL